MSPVTTTAAPSPVARRLRQAPVWRVGVAAAIGAAAATALWAALASAAGVTMAAGNPGAAHADAIGPMTFAVATCIDSALGIGLAVVLARRARRPARTFLLVTIPLAVLTLVQPLTAGATAASTKVVLVIAHVIAATIFITAMNWRLRVVEPAVSLSDTAR
jgi:Family of unknown function (DUF6069)